MQNGLLNYDMQDKEHQHIIVEAAKEQVGVVEAKKQIKETRHTCCFT